MPNCGECANASRSKPAFAEPRVELAPRAGLTTNSTYLINASANVSAAANVTPETAAQNFSNGTDVDDKRSLLSLSDLRNGTLPAADAGGVVALAAVAGAGAPAAARQLLAVAAAGAAGVVVLVLSVSAVRWGAAQGRAYDSRLMQYISLSWQVRRRGGRRRRLAADLAARPGRSPDRSRLPRRPGVAAPGVREGP
ncbi:unnamed protein product, partial [Prorocentrum cordatum]